MIDLVNQFGDQWAQYFGLALIQNTLFVSLILLIVYFLRRVPANLKYTICLIGLIKLLLPPLIPAWFLTRSATPLPSLSGIMLTLPAGEVVPRVGAIASRSPHLSLPGLLFLVWMGGAGFYLMSALVSSIRLMATLRRATPIDGRPWIEAQQSDRIQIYISDRIPMPLTFGLFPKRIYVPEAWGRWSDQCRRMVISHELAHIRRCDGLVNVLQILAGAVYFFNPLVWWFNRQVNQYREMVCDDAVVSGNTSSAMEYSSYLVEIAESVVQRSGIFHPASALLRCRNGLLRRIHYQMMEGTMNAISRKRKWLVLVGLFALILPLSFYCGSTETRQNVSSTSDAASLDKYKAMQIVKITVKGGGEIKIDSEVTARQDLGRKLNEITRGNKEEVLIFLSAEADVKMDLIREIQEKLVQMDLRKIVYDREAVGFDDLTLILPSEDDQERLNQIPEEYIAVLELRPTGQAFFDGEPIGLWEIPEAVKEKLSENPKLIVVIRSFGISPFDNFATSLALVKRGGATRIAIDIPLTIE